MNVGGPQIRPSSRGIDRIVAVSPPLLSWSQNTTSSPDRRCKHSGRNLIVNSRITLSWGHLRPAIAVCSSLLAVNEDIQMTLLIPSSLVKPAAAELQRYPFDYSRFKIIHGGQSQSDATGLRPLLQMFQYMEETKEALKDIFTKLILVCGPQSILKWDCGYSRY
jgi:hypothetical protein